MKFGSLFAGIGGFDLGLERAGMECAWQVEIDDYCQRVLEKHWPNVPKYRDVREVGERNLEPVDLICGGFPCQDISCAGKGAGINGERSGLWWEFARILGEMGPRYVLLENVSALLTRGLDAVLGTLASLGYDSEWHCIQAADVGAPHLRDRVFILAYSNGERLEGAEFQREPDGFSQGVGHKATLVANPDCQGLAVGQSILGNAGKELATFKRDCSTGAGQWATEPEVGRTANGIPNRVDRLRGLGNAVVPQVAEWIGRRILECTSN